MGKTTQLVLLVAFITSQSHAFLPPLQTLLKDSVGNRKPNRNLELVIRHRVMLSPSEVINIEEHMATDDRGFTFSWKVMGSDATAYGIHERGQYITAGMTLSTRSNAFLRYLTVNNPDTLRDALLAERFISREQLMQFKPTFTPNGDPQLWEVKDNYIRHESIYIKRLGPHTPAIVVEGPDNSGKSVYFAKNGEGIERFEWKEGDSTISWNFDNFGALKTPGLYPRKFRFLKGGQEWVSSELIVHRPGKPQVANEFRRLIKSPRGMTPEFQKALQILLSYR